MRKVYQTEDEISSREHWESYYEPTAADYAEMEECRLQAQLADYTLEKKIELRDMLSSMIDAATASDDTVCDDRDAF